MSKKKKKSNLPQQRLSPKIYVLTRARQLPVYKCLINADWQENKLASISLTRQHSNGNVTAGFFLVDLMAKGVKDTHYVFNQPEKDFFDSLHNRWPGHLEEIPYSLAHNIIYGALEFAEDYNFKPHRDFDIASYMLEEDTEAIELIDLEFGIGGKPAFVDAIRLHADPENDDDSNEDMSLPDFDRRNDQV